MAVMISGQTIAMSRLCVSIHVSPTTEGLPKRSRIAVAVDDTGFHIAMVPSSQA